MTDRGPEATTPPAGRKPTPECLAVVESTDSEGDLCTIYSIASEDSLVTAWLSAHEGSYCTLEERR
ncbi:DUF7511 domain-containing protein [Halorubrum luteum]